MLTKQYPLNLPIKDARQLATAKKKTAQPVNQLIIRCIRRALPDVVSELLPRPERGPRARIVVKDGVKLLTSDRVLTLADTQRALEDFP